jgi:hypothetical protein
MAVIDRNWLEKYLDLNLNVLFKGLHGVGKTEVIKEVMNNRFGDKWRYFSSSTLDPWVDLIGTPRPVEKDGKTYLDIIRPEFIVKGQVEAIYFDEFNRAPDKVLNAVMELIQFKSINGFKLPHLKVVWAAINPEDDDDTYSVNHLDPAHIDRFHIHYNVPYKLDEDYLKSKFPGLAQIFIDWWKTLPGHLQLKASPRRVDYAIEGYKNGCRLEDFLPVEVNIKALRDSLGSMPFRDMLKNITSQSDAEVFLRNQNNATKLLDLVKQKNKDSIDFFVKYGSGLPKELVEPFIDLVHAQKNGQEVVDNLTQLIDLLPDDKGNQGTAAIINNVSLELLYKKGGSLENDIRAIGQSKRQLIAKLANRCADVMITCRSSTLERIFWGIKGKAAGEKTNFYKIVVLLSKIGGYFTAKQKNVINNRLYGYKVVDDMHFL